METPSLSELNILLVEDNPGDRDLIIEYLEATGNPYLIETAATLDEALKIANSRKINIVLLDLGLPDSSGLSTLKKFSLNSPGISIVVLTGLDDEKTGIEAIREGAQDYLVKGKVNAGFFGLT